jgi:alpha-N-arabinofuranosidase
MPGNEMDGDWQICAHTPQEYARLCRKRQDCEMDDPAVETVACGSCTDEIGHRTFGTMGPRGARRAYDVVDYLSLHRYYNYNPGKQLAYPMHDNPTDIPYFFTDLEQFLETIIACATR